MTVTVWVLPGVTHVFASFVSSVISVGEALAEDGPPVCVALGGVDDEPVAPLVVRGPTCDVPLGDDEAPDGGVEPRAVPVGWGVPDAFGSPFPEHATTRAGARSARQSLVYRSVKRILREERARGKAERMAKVLHDGRTFVVDVVGVFADLSAARDEVVA